MKSPLEKKKIWYMDLMVVVDCRRILFYNLPLAPIEQITGRSLFVYFDSIGPVASNLNREKTHSLVHIIVGLIIASCVILFWCF